jgi:hypothetical protein
MNPAPPPAAKKSNVLLWILVGVGGFFALILIVLVAGGLFIAHKVKQAGVDPGLFQRNPALAATKLMTTMNPDIEFVSVDEGRQEITLREKKSGKTYIISYDDARRGRFNSDGGMRVKSAEGTFQVGGDAKVPTWVPDYPGSNPKSAFSARGAAGQSGNFSFDTDDSPDRVAKFYRDEFDTSGLKVTSVTTSSGRDNGQMLTAQDEHKHRTINVIIGGHTNETGVNVTYATDK